MFDNRHEIRIQRTLEYSYAKEAEKLEPESKERTMTISKLTMGIGFSEASIKVFDDLDSKEQQATTRL
jgi:hypothetical protein